MTLSQKAKQAKINKKTQKRKAQLKQRAKNSKQFVSIALLHSGSIHECFVSEPQGTNPFYSMLISRLNSTSGNILAAHFLIDADNGIVEDVLLTQENSSSFLQLKSKLSDEFGFTLKSTPPEIAKKFIISAVTHAHSLGYEPHQDYHCAKEIFFDVNEALYPNVKFQFGA